MWRYRYPEELYHYGVKGMKWGVRRSKESLRYNKSSVIASVNRSVSKTVTKNGIKLTALSDHAGDQARDRKVSAKAIIDAVRNPLYTESVTIDKKGRPSQRFIGKNATVNVNPSSGVISTVWRTGTKTRKKYERGGR